MKSTLPRIVEQTIRKHTLLSAHDKVLVALSGGADSAALLRVMHDLGYNTEALHCNFHLRGDESDRDEKFVTRLCHERGIPLHIRHFDTQGYAKEKKLSIEMAARELRYAWFEEMLQERGAYAICVAHHQKDQAETLLLNLAHGQTSHHCERKRTTSFRRSRNIIRAAARHHLRCVKPYSCEKHCLRSSDGAFLLQRALVSRCSNHIPCGFGFLFLFSEKSVILKKTDAMHPGTRRMKR